MEKNKNEKIKMKNKEILLELIHYLSFVICHLSLILILLIFAFSASSFASTYEVAPTKQYDGIWFMGFNMHKDIFSGENGKKVRKAFNLAIDRSYITKTIIGDDIVPTGMIPPTMLGYDPELEGYAFDLGTAKKLMLEAGYPVTDKRLKSLSILHTDGDKTIEIAKWIKRYLIGLGVDLQLKQVSYSSGTEWEKELKSGKHHLFLMGYKASTFGSIFIGDKSTKVFHTISCEMIPDAEDQVFFGGYEEAVAAGYKACEICNPQKEQMVDTSALLRPLFHTNGSANFMYYSNEEVDELLDQLEQIDVAVASAREPKLKEIDEILVEDPPTVNLFYITKL